MRPDQIGRCRTDNLGHWKKDVNGKKKIKRRKKEKRIRGEGIEEGQAKSHGKRRTYEGGSKYGDRRKETEGKERKEKQDQEPWEKIVTGRKKEIGNDNRQERE